MRLSHAAATSEPEECGCDRDGGGREADCSALNVTAYDTRVPRSHRRLMRRPAKDCEAVDFEVLVRDLYREVWLLCRHLSDPQAADDLTQETFLRAHKALPGFRSDSSLKTWVLSIARHTCADAIRRRDREQRKVARLIHDAPSRLETAVPDVADSVTLWAIIGQLEFDRRAAFVLTQLFGLSYDEAAAVCGCPVGTIRSRVARARSELIESHAQTTGKSRARTS
jgi:RNA polymerase sigma-70 factor, ECF subfamily